MSRRRPRRRTGGTGSPTQSADARVIAETWAGEEWHVRQVTGSAATKPYRCPGCDQLIPMATPHVVAWPLERGLSGASGLDQRRHWHTGCWRARERRPPR